VPRCRNRETVTQKLGDTMQLLNETVGSSYPDLRLHILETKVAVMEYRELR